MATTLLDDAGDTVTTASTLHCTLFNRNENSCNIIVGVTRTTASLSLIGCILIIFVIWVYKRYAIFVQRLVMYLSIAALMNSIFYVMGDLYPDGSMCNFQAWGMTLFAWSGLLWICVITFNLYWNAIQMKPSYQFEWIYHAIAWLVPLILSLFPFIGGHYGPADLWCWIIGDWKWRFGIWYCPMFVLICVMFVTYVYIFLMVSRKMKTWEGLCDPDVERRRQVLKEDVKPLKAYPFVYLALYIFPLINRIQNAVGPEPVFALMLLQALTLPLKGAVYTIVFVTDKELRRRLTWNHLKFAVRHRIRCVDSPIHEFHVQHPPQELPGITGNVNDLCVSDSNVDDHPSVGLYGN